MATKDYYNLLGVQKGASKEDIKKAYKRLAKKYHPDLNPGNKDAEHKFKEINEAVSVLADDQKRSHYDQFGTADTTQQGFDFSDFMRGQGAEDIFGGFEDVFDRFFGGSRARYRARRGADIATEVEVDLKEVAEGTTKRLHLNKLEQCPSCHGSGGKRETCSDCGGSGRVTRTQRTPFGMFQATTSCHRCNGSGSSLKEACSKCDGEGRVRVKKELEVTIPAGIEDGMQLRIRGEGIAGEHGAEAGDLYVIVHIKEHEIFERRGNNIILECPVSFTQAVLGDDIEVPTLNGKAELTIPPHTQDNTILRMRGKGIGSSHGTGDQYVKITIKIPEKLSKKEHDLVKQLADAEKEKPTSFFKKFFG